jgi:hypothetical protein
MDGPFTFFVHLHMACVVVGPVKGELAVVIPLNLMLDLHLNVPSDLFCHAHLVQYQEHLPPSLHRPASLPVIVL